MTHDELLANLDGFIFESQMNNLADLRFLKALRAVVELPMETKAKGMLMTAPANATLPELASLFYQQGYATAMNLVIQAIEKELK